MNAFMSINKTIASRKFGRILTTKMKVEDSKKCVRT